MTIQSTPPSYASVHGDLVYVVYEATKTASPVTYPNYKYIADVYVNTVLVSRLKRVPDPTYRMGVFNVGQVVRNYMAVTFNPADTLVAQLFSGTSFCLDVQVKFGEEYGFTSFSNVLTDSVRKCFNHYDRHDHGGGSDLASLTNKLLTNAPATRDLLRTSTHCFVSYFNPFSAGTSSLPFQVSFYRQDLSAFPFIFDTSALLTTLNSALMFNIALPQMNALAEDMIDSSVSYYNVMIGAQTIRVNLICEPLYSTYTLHFLNQYGVFETKLFTKVNRKTVAVEKKDFGRLPYQVSSTGAVSYKTANNVFYERSYAYASQFTEKLVLNSDFLTDEEYAWLYELVVSPLVYLQDGANFIPVSITDTNYEVKRTVNDNLTNLTITVDLNRSLNTQYR
jgi:hypothetical protein